MNKWQIIQVGTIVIYHPTPIKSGDRVTIYCDGWEMVDMQIGSRLVTGPNSSISFDYDPSFGSVTQQMNQIHIGGHTINELIAMQPPIIFPSGPSFPGTPTPAVSLTPSPSPNILTNTDPSDNLPEEAPKGPVGRPRRKFGWVP